MNGTVTMETSVALFATRELAEQTLADAIRLTIGQLLGDLQHTVEVEEEKYDHYVIRRLHIDVTMPFIHKGDRVRVVKHSSYMDSFGLEGVVKDVRPNDTFRVDVEVNGEPSRRYFSRESIEVIKKAREDKKED